VMLAGVCCCRRRLLSSVTLHGRPVEFRPVRATPCCMNIFRQLFRIAESCVAIRFTQLCSIAIFEHNISQGSVATRLRCGEMFITLPEIYC